MITEIEVKNFKSLKNVKLKLGTFNLFVGANASGKSNFFDVLRFLQGVGSHYWIDEILNGSSKGASGEKWKGIRGGSKELLFKINKFEGIDNTGVFPKISISTICNAQSYDYEISFSPKGSFLYSESMRIKDETIYALTENTNEFNSTIDVKYRSGKKDEANITVSPNKPILTQLITQKSVTLEDYNKILDLIDSLSGIQRLDLNPSILRAYSNTDRASQIGEQGQNFAALVKKIIDDNTLKDSYISWLKRLTPVELDDVEIKEGAVNDTMFAIREGDRSFPAPVLSDGTLRFAAITSAFFQEPLPDMIVLEEIENGIHADRLRLLINLLQSQSSEDCQVIATTHSPLALAWLDRKDLEYVFYFKRDEETGETTVTPFSEFPHLDSLLDRFSIMDLFAEGWFEEAI